MNTQIGPWNKGANALVVGAGAAVDAVIRGLVASNANVVRFSHERIPNETSVATAFDEAEQVFEGQVTLLVTGEQLALPQHADQMTLADWRTVTSANLDTRFFCATELARRSMANRRKAAMLHLMGKRSEDASCGNAAAASAAGGILNLNMSLAVEWARDNIRSNVIATRLVDHSEESDAKALATLAAIAAYYCSDYASYITGTCIGIDEC